MHLPSIHNICWQNRDRIRGEAEGALALPQFLVLEKRAERKIDNLLHNISPLGPNKYLLLDC